MKDKALIFGKGFIGSRLGQALGCEVSGQKIHSYADAEKEIRKSSPGIIINCIGHIGANVDDCEKDIDKALSANTFAPLILAEAALRNNIRLVHISSGCIYHYDYAKDSPIREEREPDFFELFYSRTKIYSEAALSAFGRKYPALIIRVRVPLDNRPHPRNLLTKLIGYKKVIDLPNSVTYIPDFILALKHLLEKNAQGTYNIVNEGPLLYSDLMEVYRKYKPDFKYEVIEFEKLNQVRTNLILSTEKLKNSGFKVRKTAEVLEECVREYIKY
jgi:dTDP-4-dehydrorhamnose reductase